MNKDLIIKELNSTKSSFLLVGFLFIIAAIVYLNDPIQTNAVLVAILGSVFVVQGIIKIVRYFRYEFYKTPGFLLSALVNIALGLIILSNIGATMITLTLFISFWVLLKGVSQIITSFYLKSLQFQKWWLELLSGILGIILGVLLIGDFSLSITYIAIVNSLYLAMIGILSIISYFNIRKFIKFYEDK